MTSHATHDMHANSLAAHASLCLGARQRAVLDAIGADWLTDRQIATRLGSGDPNASRPRVTELLRAGILCEVGSQIDETTGRRVRIVARMDSSNGGAQ